MVRKRRQDKLWEARARVRGKISRRVYWADGLAEAQRRAQRFFPRHKLKNITVRLNGRK